MTEDRPRQTLPTFYQERDGGGTYNCACRVPRRGETKDCARGRAYYVPEDSARGSAHLILPYECSGYSVKFVQGVHPFFRACRRSGAMNRIPHFRPRSAEFVA